MNPISLIISILTKQGRTIVKIMHKFKFILMCITLLQHLPYLLSLGLCQTVIQNVTSDQNDALLEEKLREKSEDYVGTCLGAVTFEVLEESA